MQAQAAFLETKTPDDVFTCPVSMKDWTTAGKSPALAVIIPAALVAAVTGLVALATTISTAPVIAIVTATAATIALTTTAATLAAALFKSAGGSAAPASSKAARGTWTFFLGPCLNDLQRTSAKV